ncbi:MAG: PQQ-binding-like beta-propeller repeat protein [Bacteroidales bacterium]
MLCRCRWTIPIFAAVAILALLSPAAAQDWNQWRGPNRDGVVPGFAAPKAWPENLAPAWKVTVGAGHSSPVVSGGTVYVFSRVEAREVVSAFDIATGKLVWQDAYDAPYTMNPAAVKHGPGPKSTPLVANGRLYTFGITETLSCYDAAKGKVIWRKEFSRQFPKTSPTFGTAASPILDRGLLIVHVGTQDNGALIAFDATTGDVKWQWTGDGPSYVSPIVVELAGVRQVVTQSQSNIVSVSANDGSLLWKMPFTTPYVQNIVTPVLYKDMLIFSGLEQGVFAVKVAKGPNGLAAERVWKNDQVSMYMNSPVVKGDLLFGFSHRNRGQYFCADATTGKTMWLGEPRQGDNAAMLLAGNFILSLNNDADLIVTNAVGSAHEVVKKYHVAESATYAHPVPARGGLLVKDANTLALLRF